MCRRWPERISKPPLGLILVRTGSFTPFSSMDFLQLLVIVAGHIDGDGIELGFLQIRRVERDEVGFSIFRNRQVLHCLFIRRQQPIFKNLRDFRTGGTQRSRTRHDTLVWVLPKRAFQAAAVAHPGFLLPVSAVSVDRSLVFRFFLRFLRLRMLGVGFTSAGFSEDFSGASGFLASAALSGAFSGASRFLPISLSDSSFPGGVPSPLFRKRNSFASLSPMS